MAEMGNRSVVARDSDTYREVCVSGVRVTIESKTKQFFVVMCPDCSGTGLQPALVR